MIHRYALATLIAMMVLGGTYGSPRSRMAPFRPNTRTRLIVFATVDTFTLMTQLAHRYAAQRSDLDIVVDAVGDRYVDKDLRDCGGGGDIDATNLYVPDTRLSQCNDLISVPIAIGAVPVVYNVPGRYFTQRAPDGVTLIHPIHLTPAVLASIYLGTVTRWNDPVIARLNPAAPLPAEPILAMHGLEGSADTNILFSAWLGQSDPRWRQAVGVGTDTAPTFPTGPNLVAVNHDSSLPGQYSIRTTPYSLGFVDYVTAFAFSLQTAALQNRTGRFAIPSRDGLAAAARGALHDGMPMDFRRLFVSSGDPVAFDPSNFVFLIVHRTVPNASDSMRQPLKDFLLWALDDRGGQRYLSSMQGYRPISCTVMLQGETVGILCALSSAAQALAASVEVTSTSGQ